MTATKKTSVYLESDKQRQQVKRVAKQLGISQTILIRTAIAEYCERHMRGGK